MRHHAHHVAFAAEDAGDVAGRAIGIFDVAEGDAIFGFKFVERALVGEILAFAVRDRDAEDLVFFQRGSKVSVTARSAGTSLIATSDGPSAADLVRNTPL